MKIEHLSKHSHMVSEIAEQRYRHFGYLAPELDLSDFHEGLQSHLNLDQLPIAYVALEDDKFAGIFCLRECDMETHPHLTPWLGGVLVHPDKRNRGIGESLVKAAEAHAKSLGFDRLYLFTIDKAEWYAKLGWNIIEQTTYEGHPATVMEKELREV